MNIYSIMSLTNVNLPSVGSNLSISDLGIISERRFPTSEKYIRARGRGYKTVLSTLCSNSMLKPRFRTVLNAQRRSPNFLSTVSYSDLSTERPNPEYAQDHAQRRTQANKDGSSRRNWSIS